MATRDCIKLVAEAFGDVSDKLIRSIAEDLSNIKNAHEASFGTKMSDVEFRNVAQEYINMYRADAARAKLATAQNIMKYNSWKSDLRGQGSQEAMANRILEGLHGSLRRAEGAANSVWFRYLADASHHEGALMSRLHEKTKEYPDGLFDIATSEDPSIQKSIHIELSELNKQDGSPGKTGNKDALEVAKIIKRSLDAAQGLYEKGGAFVRKLYGYAGPRRWDPEKLANAGEDKFVADMIPFADKKRMLFSLSDGDSLEERIRKMYRGIVSGEHERLNDFGDTDNSLVRIVDMPANLAKRAERSRTFHFIDAESEFDLVSKYGYNENFVEKTMSAIKSASRSSAFMDKFGTNPQANIARLRKEFSITGPEFEEIDRVIRIYTNADHDPRVTLTSNVGDNIRAWTYSAKMGIAAISSLPDLPSRARELMTNTSRGFLDGHARAIESFFEGVPESMKIQTAKKIGLYVDGMLEDMNRYGYGMSRPGFASKLVRLTNKANLLNAWVRANKVGHSRVIASDLADMSGLKFSELQEIDRVNMSRHGIDSAKWDLIRAANLIDGIKAKEDTGMIGLNDIDLVPPGVVEKIMSDRGIKIGESGPAKDRAIRRFSADTKTTLGVYFMARVNNSMLEVGLRERSAIAGIFGRGNKNTVGGQVSRFVTMFKSYPTSFMMNHINDILMSRGASKWQDGLRSGKFDHGAFASTLVTMTLLGYVSNAIIDVASGKKPRDPDVVEAMVRGGAGGLLGDFLLGEFDRRYGRSVESFALGPVLGQASDVMDVWQNIKAYAFEDDKNALKKARNQAGRIFVNNLPFSNMFYLRGALNHTMLYDIQERMNPGYLMRMQKTMREKGQEFYIDPRAHWVLPR